MSIDVNALPSYWRRAVETTTPVALVVPAMTRAEVYYPSQNAWACVLRDDALTLSGKAAYYITFNDDGTTTRVERPVTVTTRVWTEKPPNDETIIVVLYSHDDGIPREVYTGMGKRHQHPEGIDIAWCLLSDLLTAPPASVVLLDEDDCYAWDRADGMTPIDQRDFLNARLRAKRPAPVVVTEQQAKAAVIAAQHEQVVSPLNTSYFELLAASLTRQLNGGQP